MEKNKTKNINFFKKVWYSITKFDKYPDMATEGLRSAIKYLAIMTAIVTVFVIINSMIEMQKMVGDVATYIENNIPNFSYSDGKMSMENIEEPIIISDIKYNGVDKIVIDPLSENKEQKTQREKENQTNGVTIYFFKDQIVLQTKLENSEAVEQPYIYSDFIKNYTQGDFKEFDKQQVVEFMRSTQMSSYYLRYATSLTIYLFIANIFVAILNVIELAALGWISTSLGRIKMKIKAICSMAIYSLTLPMILNIIYIVINYFTEFTINYFQIAYIAIAYVYLVAAIFILKDDFMKRQQEVTEIQKEQEKVRQEILEKEEKEKREKEQEKKDNKEEKKKNKEDDEDNNEQEPKGSEA